MIGRLATACLLFVLPKGFTEAQDTASDDGGFCATTPPDLLAALDGRCSLRQGAGAGRGGSTQGQIVIPLPPRPPVTMTLALKLDTPSSGRGIIAFKGKMNGATFTGSAPEEMSR